MGCLHVTKVWAAPAPPTPPTWDLGLLRLCLQLPQPLNFSHCEGTGFGWTPTSQLTPGPER